MPAVALVLVAVVMISSFGLTPAGRSALASGLSYPLLSFGHVIATLAVGVWAGRIGGHAPVVLPLAFVLGMGLGMLLGADGSRLLQIPEVLTWASALVLTVAAASAARPPLEDAFSLAALFGLFHGSALGSGFAG
ncbi:HupE/UreJ family protein [Rubellimicrobium roseum]|uniref:HupE/UreJ family protein n=1 Tax=Rubellimicrobium roseum TaxID=687525 RepID=A0A5C4N4N8_9RHOB|nr:HupE/UreJ family protein [Rubellimicrobium roseum]TNC63117.1 hypothetical protein FHG71_19720 [Rubellimicrobium roseum]